MQLNYTQQKDVRSRAFNRKAKQNHTTRRALRYANMTYPVYYYNKHVPHPPTNPPPPPCKKPKVFMFCVFSFNAKASPACLRPPLCHLAQKFRSPSLFVSLWLPACWCPTPTLNCPTCCLLRLSRRAVLRGCFRYIYTSKENSSVTE